MRLSVEDPDHQNTRVYDALGNKVLGVQSYDTETKEVTMIVFGESIPPNTHRAICEINAKGEPVPMKVTFKLEGSYAMRVYDNGEKARI